MQPGPPVVNLTGTSADLKPAVGGYQQLTVSTGVSQLTVPAGAVYAVASLEVAANGLRWRDDGTNPTASVGVPVATVTPLIIPQLSLAPIRFTRSGAADAVLSVTYYTRQ
jgi:hypothetical protein